MRLYIWFHIILWQKTIESKLQVYLQQRVDSLEKTDAGRDWGQKKGMTEDEMAGWHHWLDGCESRVNSGRWWWTGRSGVLQFMGLQRVGHNWVTELNWLIIVIFNFNEALSWKVLWKAEFWDDPKDFHLSVFVVGRKWQPIPLFLPGECQGRGSLVGCRLWDHTESNTTEVT